MEAPNLLLAPGAIEPRYGPEQNAMALGANEPYLSVSGVMTSRGVLPRYSYEYRN